MQPTSHAAMSGDLLSGPENGGWRGPERSDYTAPVFRPLGLGLDSEGAAGPKPEKSGTADDKQMAAEGRTFFARRIVTGWTRRGTRLGAARHRASSGSVGHARYGDC